MKKRILLLCILTIFFSTGMEGCPDLDPTNYVEFTLTTIVDIQFRNSTDDKVLDLSAVGSVIELYNRKDGAEYCRETLTVGIDNTATLICTHNVYKEQPVDSTGVWVALPENLAERGYVTQFKGLSYRICTWSWDEIFTMCGAKFASSCATSFRYTFIVTLIVP